MLIWITGFPGSGKTTLAHSLKSLVDDHYDLSCVDLDGDWIRSILPFNSGYSLDERKSLSLFYAKLASKITSHNSIVIASFFSMFEDIRLYARNHNENYYEIFINPPFSSLALQNKKGIYSDDSVPSQLSCYDIPSCSDFTISQIITPDLSATYASIVFNDLKVKFPAIFY